MPRMAKLEIVKGADNPILRAVSKPVEKFDDELRDFVGDMHEAMLGANGLGIAAPQVGRNIRVFIVVLNLRTPHEVMLPMVNPKILWESEETEVDEEGCLSLPGEFGKVERAKSVRVEFYDLDGGRKILELSGLNARVVLHEKDHLDGVLFVDKLV